MDDAAGYLKRDILLKYLPKSSWVVLDKNGKNSLAECFFS